MNTPADFAIMRGLLHAAADAKDNSMDKCQRVVRTVVATFEECDLTAGEAMVVLLTLTHQLARIADDGIAAEAAKEGVEIPTCEAQHVLCALTAITLKMGEIANDNGEVKH